MLSAAGDPITIYGPIRLPGIAPSNIAMYELLRSCHIVAALSLFFVFTAHVGVVLFHALVLRDRIIDRMALWPAKRAGRQHDPSPSQRVETGQ
jgi:cytochrome b561